MKSVLETLYEISKTILYVLVMAFLIRFFLFQPFVVEGASMEPNLHNGEYLIVDKLSYKINEPNRGNIIVLKAPDNPGVDYIKRIIGLPSEEVEINHNQILINGKVIGEEYLPSDFKTLISEDPGLILKRQLDNTEYFVMGDNRSHSLDSRIFGAINKNAIIGKAWVIMYPWEFFGKIAQPSY